MIGKLTGLVEAYEAGCVLLHVNGVGYIVQCSESTIGVLRDGGVASLLIEMHTKEDGTTLYGFCDQNEKICFRCIHSVQGVGGKIALAILSKIRYSDVAVAIMQGNTAVFKEINGIGPKLATRIVNELKFNKHVLYLATLGRAAPVEDHVVCDNLVIQEAISAVLSLGFSKKHVVQVTEEVCRSGRDFDLQFLIKAILEKLDKDPS